MKIWLEKIGVNPDDLDVEEVLYNVKEASLTNRRLLTEDEFRKIVDNTREVVK